MPDIFDKLAAKQASPTQSPKFPLRSIADAIAVGKQNSPEFQQALQQSKNKAANAAPFIAGTLAAPLGTGAMTAAGAAGSLARPLINGQPADLNSTATDALINLAMGKAIDVVGPKIGKLANMMTADKGEAKAGFNLLSNVVGDKPIPVTQDLSESLNNLKNVVDYRTAPTPVRSILKRFQRGSGNVTFDEARQMYSAITEKMAPEDIQKLNPTVMYHLNDVRRALDGSIRATADRAGMLPIYDSAMSNYHGASQYQVLKNSAKEVASKEVMRGAAKGLGYTAGGGIGYAILKELGIIK